MRKRASNVYEDHSESIWGKAWLLGLAVSGEDPHLPIELRIFLIGFKRYRANGHACFRPGELKRHLPKATGEMFSDRYINSRIRILVDAGLLAPPSNTRCLVYPRERIDMQTYKGQYLVCPEHKTSDQWSGRFNGWMESQIEPPLCRNGIDWSGNVGSSSVTKRKE